MADNAELMGTEGVEPGTGQTPASQPTNPQQADRPTDQQAKVNWMEQPEFKQWQSKHDQRYQQATRQNQELQQRLAAYEQQMEALQTRDLDEPGKLAYANQKLQRQLQERDRILQALDAQRQEQEGRQRVFGRIAGAVGAAGITLSPDLLAEAADADDAWERAVRHLVESLPKRAAALSEKREANAVDLGGGAASAGESQWEQRADDAWRKKDAKSYVQAILAGKGYT